MSLDPTYVPDSDGHGAVMEIDRVRREDLRRLIDQLGDRLAALWMAGIPIASSDDREVAWLMLDRAAQLRGARYRDLMLGVEHGAVALDRELAAFERRVF